MLFHFYLFFVVKAHIKPYYGGPKFLIHQKCQKVYNSTFSVLFLPLPKTYCNFFFLAMLQSIGRGTGDQITNIRWIIRKARVPEKHPFLLS